jgi:hypothetical protein
LTIAALGNALGMKNLRKAVTAIVVAGLMAGAGACSASGSADKGDGGVKVGGEVEEKDDGY